MPADNQDLLEIQPPAPETPPPQDVSAVLDKASLPWPVNQGAGGLVDRFGRPFDPGLHLADKKGRPAVSAKGRLISLPGKPTPKGPPPVSQNPPTLEAPAVPLVFDTPAPGPAPAVDLNPNPAPAVSDEVGATINAETILDLWRVAGAVLFGASASAFVVDPLTELREDKRLLETSKRWLIGTGRTQPAGGGLVHIVAGLRYFLRAWSTNEGQEHLKKLLQTLKGNKPTPPPKEGPPNVTA